MATLTLYDNTLSSNALRARFLLALLELPYDKVEIPFERPRPGWFAEIHPLATIPALRDGDAVIGESNTILRYLAAREGRADLYPADLLARAHVDWVLDTWSMHVRPAAIRVEMPALFGPTPDATKVAETLPDYVAVLEQVERLVRGDGTMCAGGLTIADVSAAPTLYRAAKLDLPWDRLPRLAAVRDTVLAHPAFIAAGPVR